MNSSFEERFWSLTGFSPMNWQCRLFKRFVADDLPDACDIPTGLGKTSVIVIWLLALVRQAEDGRVNLPRRLVYIVNRRTVVDQATETVERLRSRLLEPGAQEWQDHADTLSEIAEALDCLRASDGAPLGVSTLRGELADNEEWKADPARPAIVVGTIDMIGSKLLFSGYGDGRYGRAHHAGLIGQDALVVHDEAHLTPAFSDLLHAIAQEQARESARSACFGHPVRVIELSATTRPSEGGPHFDKIFTLESEDEKDGIARDRLTAAKRLQVHPAPEDSVTNKMVELSKAHEGERAKILIYVRSPEQAGQVASALAKSLGKGAEERVALLTGTIRGHERDGLLKTNLVYRALLDPDCRVERTVYLVSTSAGEVGIDLDADHLVCDLTTLDALIQRVGRVNRRGGKGREARVHVVGDAPGKDRPSKVDMAVATTLRLLRRWDEASEGGVDVSPGNLLRLLGAAKPQDIEKAFSPRPEGPPLTDILLDSWSLTSIQKMPGRPEVAAFLHGLTHDPPDTFVAWRREISILEKATVDEPSLRDWFGACRVNARERLRDRTDRVKASLARLLKVHRDTDKHFDFSVVLLDERGDARWSKLSEIVKEDVNLDYRTVVLPVEAGGLDRNGMLDPTAVKIPDGVSPDVAEEGSTDDRRERWLHRRSVDGERYERLLTREIFDAPPAELREKERISLHQPEEAEEDEEAETVELVLLVSPAQSALVDPETASGRQTLADHTGAIAAQMSAIAERLGLAEPIRVALVTAARWHDRGKDRSVWQRYAHNDRGSEPLAKSVRYLHPRVLGGYRHEFGSLLDAVASDDLQQCTEPDLVLHLIAAHHGWARPHFEPRSHDNTHTTAANDKAALQVMRRFGQLQQRFGRWGLAWLESLLRCADIAASTATPSGTETAGR